MDKVIAYYAHPLCYYGSKTEPNLVEVRDIAILEALGLEVLNPNQPKHQRGYRESGKGMQYFVDLVEQCGAFAFRPFPDGRLGAGVMVELQAAEEMGLPVIELPGPLSQRFLTVEQTREYLSHHGRGSTQKGS